MQVLWDPLGRDDPPRGAVLTIGNFDGVHLGHQEILRTVVGRAEALQVPAVAMTFDPHPVKVLRPREAPRLLTTMPQRLQLVEGCGIDSTLVLPFGRDLASMRAEEFVRKVLVDRLAIREVHIGTNFRFGADREGTVDLLQAMGRELGFEANGVAPVVLEDAAVSSTRARRAVAHGRVEKAWRLLGHPPFVDGAVFRGERLGRKLGFPTLNIAVENELFPAHGVYVTVVHIPSFGRNFPSVTNIGVRPTVYENYKTTVEAHLLDFTADVYREKVRLFFVQRLRDEKVFPSPMQLVAQIRQDVEGTRTWFLNHDIASMELVAP